MDVNGKKMLVVPGDFFHILHPKLLMLESWLSSWNENENKSALFWSFKSSCLCPMDTQVYIFDSPYILQKQFSYKSILKSVRF